ncbi:MAG: GGDEF domain-containing protein [Oscillospiraceae bacterium]|nr:GGDEF domain-containing protein [Oscillospiraceae bacterium]
MSDIDTTKDISLQNTHEGIRLGRFYLIATSIFAVLALLLLLSTYLMSRGYKRMEAATERYITAQQSAANMQAASDYLTAEARAFIVTGNSSRARNFFEETEVTRRRDHALKEIEEILDSPSAYAYLSAAMDCSNELLKIECYAMRLAAESYGFNEDDLPERLREVELESRDLMLSADAQREKALEQLFDENYQSYKDLVRKNVALSVETLIDVTRVEQMESTAQLLRLIRRENALIIIILLMAVLLVLATVQLVTKPLRSYISHIRRDETLPEEGASELRFLARTYNQVREQNVRRREQLSYDASHDALTGVFNRSVFEKLRTRLDGQDKALLIIDIDKFKDINDCYGHDTGDRALCFVSALLQQNFRAEDYICRIGGDEFTVIMVHADSSMRDLVAEKIERINQCLQTPRDGLPAISISAGVAFGDRKDPTEDIYKDADTALYRAKERHNGSCEFY